MKHQVQVALIGDVNQPYGEIPYAELHRLYRKRKTVTVEIDEDETLARPLREAAEKLGVPSWAVAWPSIGFYRPEDEDRTPPHYSDVLPLVDSGGSVNWKAPVTKVSYRRVLDAVEAGALHGDPSRIHLAMVSTSPESSGSRDWNQVLRNYELLRTVLDDLALQGDDYGRRELLQLMLKRSQDNVEALRDHNFDWYLRGALTPERFDDWLNEHPWDPQVVANLLGCSRPGAEAILWAFGFGEIRAQEWRRGATEDAKFTAGHLGALVLRTVWTGFAFAPDHELKEEFRARAEALLKTGESPPPVGESKVRWLRDRFTRVADRVRQLWWRVMP